MNAYAAMGWGRVPRLSALLGVSALLAALVPSITWATASSDFDLVVETLKVDTTGGPNNRYSLTNAAISGYGVYLSYPSGRLTIERRKTGKAQSLKNSAAMQGGMAPDQWYTLYLYRRGKILTAEAYSGQVLPPPPGPGARSPTPLVRARVKDTTYSDFTQFNVQGGYVYDTDNIRVQVEGGRSLAEDFDDGNLSDWRTLYRGQVDYEDDDTGGYVLRKFGFNDPNGGSVDLRTLLTFDPVSDGILAIEDYATEYGVSFDNAELVEDATVFADARGVRNTNTLASESAVITFADPVTAIDFRWVRFFEDATFVATAYEDEARQIPVANIFVEGCTVVGCSLEHAGTETISATTIKALEFTGIRPGGSPDGPEESVGLDSLGFVPSSLPPP